ncbi:hypothetical protein FKR81_38245 [Lentzea tibetensis]|uniref:Uncharacterized protein n=1 Tax=Lentzea tibetensis TaxID=2591470 RepID=A0A563EHG6_9PSEU|nr:recombinase family protein [Lentzea tibetensis]TWP45816.1 hypothetical protein FKR81_38245 [Lentzea tibetensis]
MMLSPKPSRLELDQRNVVYGYVLAPIPDELEIAALHMEIVHFCASAGYRLEHVFTDREVPDDVVVRPGFAALLEALELPASHAVVVPHVDHISTDNRARAELYRQIRRTASVVIDVHDEPDDVKADGA